MAVRSELAELEGTLERLRAELATLEKAAKLPMPQVHPAWVRAKLDRLDQLIREHPVRARIELVKHLDGDLAITPRPPHAAYSPPGPSSIDAPAGDCACKRLRRAIGLRT